MSKPLPLSSLFPLSNEEAATLLEYEREGGSLDELGMIKAIWAMRGLTPMTASIAAEVRKNPDVYVEPIVVEKARPTVIAPRVRRAAKPMAAVAKPSKAMEIISVNMEVPAELKKIVEAPKAEPILITPVSVTTFNNQALEARFLAETAVKAKPEGKFAYTCDTCGCEVKTNKQLNPSWGIYCAEHRAVAKAVTPCVVVKEAPVAPAPIVAQTVAEPLPVVEEVAATEAEPTIDELFENEFVNTEEVTCAPWSVYSEIGDRLGKVIKHLEKNGIKFGLIKPATVEALEAKIAATPKWHDLEPEALIYEALYAVEVRPEVHDEVSGVNRFVESVQEVVQAKAEATIAPIWSLLDNGRKVRKVVQLLEELGVFNFGLVKPTNVQDLKRALKAKPNWMTEAANSMPMILKAVAS